MKHTLVYRAYFRVIVVGKAGVLFFEKVVIEHHRTLDLNAENGTKHGQLHEACMLPLFLQYYKYNLCCSGHVKLPVIASREDEPTMS